MYNPVKLSFTQDTYETSPSKREAIGALRITADGRLFRYPKAAERLYAGGMSFNIERSGFHGLQAGRSSVGDRVITVAAGAVPVVENMFEDGFIHLPGGYQCRVLSNTGCSSGRETVITTAEPLPTVLTGESHVRLVQSPWNGVLPYGELNGTPVGVCPCDVPAGHYFFVQTGGMACCRIYSEDEWPGLTAISSETPKFLFGGKVVAPCLLSID